MSTNRRQGVILLGHWRAYRRSAPSGTAPPATRGEYSTPTWLRRVHPQEKSPARHTRRNGHATTRTQCDLLHSPSLYITIGLQSTGCFPHALSLDPTLRFSLCHADATQVLRERWDCRQARYHHKLRGVRSKDPRRAHVTPLHRRLPPPLSNLPLPLTSFP